MRPDRHQGILAPWQFIAILALLVCIGILLNPDLLKFYAGKPDLLISEFLADNQTNRIDVDGDHSDWIEIYNASDETISLKGWYLTDDFRNLNRGNFCWFGLQARTGPIGWTIYTPISNYHQRANTWPLYAPTAKPSPTNTCPNTRNKKRTSPLD
jgi:hypothetical protein